MAALTAFKPDGLYYLHVETSIIIDNIGYSVKATKNSPPDLSAWWWNIKYLGFRRFDFSLINSLRGLGLYSHESTAYVKELSECLIFTSTQDVAPMHTYVGPISLNAGKNYLSLQDCGRVAVVDRYDEATCVWNMLVQSFPHADTLP